MSPLESTDTTSNLTKRAVAGTAWSSLSTAGKQVLSIASVATVARLLGPRAYGVMAMANILIVFILNFGDLGTGSSIIQRRTITKAFISSIFWVNLAFGFLMAVLVSAASPLMAKFFRTPELIPILCVLGFSFWVASAGITHSSFLYREMRFRALAAADVSAALIAYLVALTFAYKGFGVWSLVFANLANSAVTVTGYWIGARWCPAWEFAIKEVKSVARYSLNLSGFGIVNYFSRNADNITVGKVLGQAALGDYGMAYNLMLTPIQNISAVVAQATFPAFARIQGEDERFRLAYTRSSMLIGLISFPVLAGMGVVADPMIRTILGAKWLGAIRVFQILAPVGLAQSVYTTIGQIYMAKGRTDRLLRWGIVQTLVLVASFLIGIHWGVLGVATAYCLTFLCITMPPGFIIAFRLIGLKLTDFARALTPQLAITGCMTLLCWLWLRFLPMIGIQASWILLTSAVILGATFYILALLIIWPRVMEHLETALTSSENPFIAQTFARARGLRLVGRSPRSKMA
ncbi:MAG: MOP flippase family protein [Acidobacteriaceae bacterium]|nr:MOP flippase family protein [Acidobacteriaceae bacterium]